MIVARDREHASVPGHAIRVAVPQHVAGAIDARTFAVPEREDAFDLALGIGRDALASERGGRGELLVDRRHEAHAMRVEQRLRLPHREVDAAERRAAIAGDESGGVPAARAIEARLRLEAKTIRDKYLAPPHTTDFAILFVPTEGLYAEALRRPGLVDALQREHRVTLAGPTTLLATLTSLQMGFRTLAIEQRSAEVWKLLGAVKTDFGSFAQVLQKTQEKLRQATDTIDTAFVRTRSIERKLRRVEALDDAEAKSLLDAPDALLDDASDDASDDAETAAAENGTAAGE